MTQLSTTPIAIGIAQHEETRCLIVIDAHQCDSPPQMSTPTQTVNKLLPGPIRRRSSLKPLIPLALQKPGIEMLKVSVKSSRRVKSRKAWLEMGTRGSSYDTEDIRVCWEKNSRGVGPKNDTSIPVSSIRSIRYGSDISPYRTSLHLSPLVEPRWITLIYLVANPSLLAAASSQTPVYKLVHLIAPTEEAFETWKETLTGFLGARNVGHDNMGEWEELKWREAGGGIEEEILVAEETQLPAERVVREEEVLKLCKRLGMGMSKEDIASAFQKSAAPNDFLDFASFQQFVKLLKQRGEVDDIFEELSEGELGISRSGWARFLVDVQKFTASSAVIGALFTKFTRIGHDHISLEGFTSFLLSFENSAMGDDTSQDMTRPLCEYYIASSHNTYLVGNQLQGDSTAEGYIRALQQGCRCVELDVWAGDDDSPIITHGRTLTTKMSARDAIEAIAKYSFLASNYPVILSLEIHCGVAQQDKLVAVLIEALGDRLVVARIDHEEGSDILKLPSPEDLKGKVLLKAKDLSIDVTTTFDQLAAALSADESGTSESSPGSDSDLKRVFNAVRRKMSSHGSMSSDSANSSRVGSEGRSPSLSRTATFESSKQSPLSPTLSSLLIYTTGVKPRGFNQKESYAPTHVLSFGENHWGKMIADTRSRHDVVAHNRTHLTRGYPKGLRVTSTNFLPHHLWSVGVQMVALNWQTFDLGMELNRAMFARAGRSGYVLKPEILRRKGPEKDKDALVRIAHYILEIEVISAQQLPRNRDNNNVMSESESSSMDPFVEISLFIPNANSPARRRTKVVCGNAFNPIFRSSFSIPFATLPSLDMLSLVFLRLEVLNARGNMRSAIEEGRGEFVGAYCLSLGSLQSGYRHLPLYDHVGDQHLFSSLFIKSSITLVS